MRIDLSDLDRLEGIAEALARLFWCLIAVAFLAAVLGSAGTGLLVLILGGTAFATRVGFEDFARARRGREERPTRREDRPPSRRAPKAKAQPEPEFTVYRSPRRRRTRSAV